MPFLDQEGRLFGRVNVIDLLAAAGVCLVVAVAYVRLSTPDRAVPVFPGEENTQWTAIDLVLPTEHAFLAEAAQAGEEARDPRSGAPIARVEGGEADAGPPRVAMRLRAMADTQGRLIYDGAPLVPGRRLRIETESAVYEGTVGGVRPAAP